MKPPLSCVKVKKSLSINIRYLVFSIYIIYIFNLILKKQTTPTLLKKPLLLLFLITRANINKKTQKKHPRLG
ncbi:MAG: hypothetical protein XD98_0060 [Microgenomates bacterium 39_6]|nr:MAG: hypothetical protein XD98_0060 [Microgenomates bacterium 39_6]